MGRLLEKLFFYLFWLSFFILVYSYFKKDTLPEPGYYDLSLLEPPKQTRTRTTPFKVHAGGQTYTISPQFDYELYGVVVSLHDSDSYKDAGKHHRDWKDFINIRDICVIWGDNVALGVYKNIYFRNGKWTCFYSWTDNSKVVGFSEDNLSNNHLLVDNVFLKKQLSSIEVGDHIKLGGMLSSYENKANKFKRGTSVKRTDRGNGACETIYLDEVKIIKKGNLKIRSTYSNFKWITFFTFVIYLFLFFTVPQEKKVRI